MKLPKLPLLFRIETLILTAVILILILTNFTPNTFLIGWDNLLPELNIWMNLKRSFFAVWQEYQGLGLVGGMGHATDLIRQLIILPFTYLISTNLIRYFWHFAMIIIGTYTIYFGLKKLLNFSPLISLCASLFYLLNFGSIQNFWVPFEAFSTFWGFFPLLIFSLWSHLNNPSKRSIIFLSLINILAIPSFYVPTIFIVYLFCLFIVLLSHFIFSIKNGNIKTRFYLKTLLLILLLNTFWLLPFSYFLKNDVQNTQQSIGNLLATQETTLRNQNRGYLSDFLLLRGYYYDYSDNGISLMAPWRNHFSNLPIQAIGYFISIIAIIGFISLLIKKNKTYQEFTLLGLFSLSAIVLLSATPPFSFLNQLIRTSDLVNQVFRSPFTKFITPTIFTFSLLTAYGLKVISKNKYLNIFAGFLYISLFILYVFPVFKGNYIYSEVRQSIPTDHLQLIDYFNKLPSTARIANLPQGDYWGWTSYRQGIRGSGFLWYGIEQPILDRAFDVWQINNETYYWELSQALNQRNTQLLEQIFTKYSIQYIIFDNNSYFPGQIPFSKTSLATKDLLKEITSLKLIATFGQISLYQTSIITAPYITNTSQSTSILPEYFTNRTPLNQSPIPLTNTPYTSPTFTPTTFNNSYGYHLYGYSFPDAPLNQNYFLKISYKHITGYPLLIGIYPENNQFRYTTTKLDNRTDYHDQWFFLPQMEKDSFNYGISVVFNNASFNSNNSINEIKTLELYPVNPPTAPNTNSPPSQYLPSKSSIFYYTVSIPNNYSNNYLILPQSYNPGWLAFSLNNFKPTFIKDHVLINNWANGWFIPLKASGQSPQTIYIFFWPQILEFIGLLFIPLSVFWFIRRSS